MKSSRHSVLKREGGLNNLHLTGRLKQEELPALYEQADVFVLPSNYEIYGMVVAEALYFGTPIISTRTAGPVDIIRSDLHGRLLSGLDTAQWLDVLSFYGLASANSEQSAERSSYAKAQFDWVEIGRAYLGFVRSSL